MSHINPDKLPDTKEIIDIVAAIRVKLNDEQMIELKKKDKTKHLQLFQEEFKDFYDIYPSLFDQVYNNNDLEMLAKMLDAINKIKTKSVSINSAEKQLGEDLAKKYLSKWKK